MKAKKILIVDDDKAVRYVLCSTLQDWSFVPIEAESVESAIRLFDTEQPDLVLLDINLPDGSGFKFLRKIKSNQPNVKVVMITGDVFIENIIASFRAGASDFIGKPINLGELREIIDSCFNNAAPVEPPPPTSNNDVFKHIIGESPKIKELLSIVQKVAESRVTNVLLQGESGTGKDLIARAIHNASARAEKPFVAINCAALPANLIESELFGYEKGAFTDAKERKEGLFEQAAEGTIFLDEVGELEIGLQAKLLRVLEAGVFRRVGGLKDIRLNARVIAASNRNLQQASEAGTFRADLYFRLSVVEINVPALRERGNDVLILANHFIKSLDRQHYKSKKRRLSPEAAKAFLYYPWMGNVRELRNAIERALILEDAEEISMEFMPPTLKRFYSQRSQYSGMNGEIAIQLPPTGISLEAVEDSLIEQALQHTRGNVTRAAEILQISRDQMRYRLKKKKL